MRKIFLPLALLAGLFACKDQQKPDDAAADPMTKNAATTTDGKPKPVEFADASYMDMGKAMVKHFFDGDYDAWGESFADNAVFSYSSGDSLAGKKAIVDYWKERRNKFIDNSQMSNDIWLPIKVNTPQRGPDMPGVWLMSWHQVNVKYKNGKALQFWTHQDMHYNAQDKVDRMITYIDRGPINAALGMK